MKAIAPALLGKALRGWPGTVIVLQRGARPGDAAEFGAALQGPFHDLSALGEDLPGLLCVLASLDDYVGVSNANMHFLAGLGKTARVLVPYPGEWRWMRRPGPSPWFPGFETYRQPRDRDWTGRSKSFGRIYFDKGANDNPHRRRRSCRAAHCEQRVRPAPHGEEVLHAPQYTTAGGKTIKNVRVGYETYGKLNAAGDNAVFVPHFFSGTSHAAGRYKPDEKAAGYWDAIIGPGKAIDTDKHFVVSADTLVNLNVKSAMVGTVGPATLNPDTGKPYGSSFPVVSMKDSVRVHKALLDSLGVKKLQAVAGASGGAIQTMEWAVEYPQLVERVSTSSDRAWTSTPTPSPCSMRGPCPSSWIRGWKGGDYYGGAEPAEGLAQALSSSR